MSAEDAGASSVARKVSQKRRGVLLVDEDLWDIAITCPRCFDALGTVFAVPTRLLNICAAGLREVRCPRRSCAGETAEVMIDHRPHESIEVDLS